MVVSCIAAVLLPEGIRTATFLTEDEREFACKCTSGKRRDVTSSSLRTDPFPILVRRLRISNYETSWVAGTVARSPAGDTADLKEEIAQHIGTVENTLLAEEEVFEWGEVIRGRFLSPVRLWDA